MDDAEQKTPRFKGLLSIGVDELSNTLIVSAPSYLLESIREMVEELDQAAAPVSTIRVVKTGAGVNAALLQEKLLKVLGEPSPGGKTPAGRPPAKQPQKPPQGGPGRSGPTAVRSTESR